MIICIGFLLAHVRSHDGAQDQENTPMSPDPFPRERLGSGNETTFYCKTCKVSSEVIITLDSQGGVGGGGSCPPPAL